jgi:uncharacterized protein YegL
LSASYYYREFSQKLILMIKYSQNYRNYKLRSFDMSMKERAGIARRMCPVIFLIDKSSSMERDPIGAVNSAMDGLLPELISMNRNNSSIEIMVGVMTFDSYINWPLGKQLIDPAKITWTNIIADGGTSMGAAFKELDEILSVSRGLMNRASGSVAPILFLLSDGEPTDNYQDGLQKLKTNIWYEKAGKVAIGYGKANDLVLREFTGNSETVKHTYTPRELIDLIQIVTITSAMVVSKRASAVANGTSNIDPDDATAAIAVQLKTAPATLSSSTDEDW